MLSYDDLWSYFRDICGLPIEIIPNREEEMIREIHNSVEDYNNETDDCENKLTFDDDFEEISLSKGDNKYSMRKKLLALYIKRNVLKCQFDYFQSVMQYDLKEVKSKFYKDQVSARLTNISKVEKEIDELLYYLNSGDLYE